MSDNIAREDSDFKLEIGLLKRDISVFDKYFQKIDVSLEKLVEVTGQMTRMITLHDERLEQNLADAAELKKLNENRRNEIVELERKIDSQEKRILENIQSLRDELIAQIGSGNDLSDKRLKKLEVWRSLVVGGTMIILFFVGEFIKSSVYWGTQPQLPQITISHPHP